MLKIERIERKEIEGTLFFPVLEVGKELIRSGKFMTKLSCNLRKRGLPDFFAEENDSSIVLWIPVGAAKHIAGVSCSKTMVDVHWSRNIPIY